MKNKILLFIPMYNCERQIVRVLGQLTKEICSYLNEVIIVNNRSTDKGETAVQKYLSEHALPIKITLFRNDNNYGLGGSHKVAFQYAVEHGFDYIIVLHGDDQGDISNLLLYLKSGVYQKYDCFLGARFMKGSKLQGYSKFRTFGNKVYDIVFSFGCGYKIYDLGSGLNMYKVSILKNKFYLKYTDNLIFNCCMLMGSAYYRHRVKFFPIVWREDDQISNVKMVSQAAKTLKLLASFVINKKKFLASEHRDEAVDSYTAQMVYPKIHLIMPMGGGGTRFGNRGFGLPKPLIELQGKPFFYWAVQSVCKFANVQDVTFVVLQEHINNFGIDKRIREFYPDAVIYAIPHVLNGAVLTCREGIKTISDNLPILFNDCDHAFICNDFYRYCRNGFFDGIEGALLTFESDSPNFSYVKFDNDGRVIGTIEKVVASNEAICGAYYFKNKNIFDAAAESYLTKCVYKEFFMSGVYNEMVDRGERVVTFRIDEHISFGTPEEYDSAVTDERLGRLV